MANRSAVTRAEIIRSVAETSGLNDTGQEAELVTEPVRVSYLSIGDWIAEPPRRNGRRNILPVFYVEEAPEGCWSKVHVHYIGGGVGCYDALSVVDVIVEDPA